MEMDRKTIKALASDTRVNILKALAERRKMPAELSRELNLAASTIVEHLKYLEESELVEKKHTGHKWIYYELTSKGKNIAAPKFPVNMILILSLGIIVSIFSFANIFSAQAPAFTSSKEIAGVAASAPADLAKTAASAPAEINWIFVVILVVGLALVAFELWKFFKKKILKLFNLIALRKHHNKLRVLPALHAFRKYFFLLQRHAGNFR